MYYQQGHHEQAQAGFFISTFSMLAKMARADGRVSQDEIDVVVLDDAQWADDATVELRYREVPDDGYEVCGVGI